MLLRGTTSDFDVSNYRMASRPAHEKEEIEITPEMIEAGAEVLSGSLGGAITTLWDVDDLAARVYLAMAIGHVE